jgi:hypothetical protein
VNLLKGADKASVGRLRLEAAVEEERVLTGPPGLSVRDTCKYCQHKHSMNESEDEDIPQAVMPTQLSRSKHALATAS